jgi:hypothetical protein
MKKCPCNLYCPAFSANHLNAAAKLQLDCHRLESFNHYLCSSQRTHRKSHHRTKGSASTIPPRKGQQRRQHATSTGRWPESILRHVAGLVFVTEYCFFADYDTGWSRTWARISQFRLNFTAIPAGPARRLGCVGHPRRHRGPATGSRRRTRSRWRQQGECEERDMIQDHCERSPKDCAKVYPGSGPGQ